MDAVNKISQDSSEHGFAEASMGAASSEKDIVHERSGNLSEELQSARQNINTPVLRTSTENGDFEKTKLLLEKSLSKVNDIDDRGWCALHIAAEKGDLRIFQLLTDKGANPSLCHDNLKDVDEQGWNATHFAAQGGDIRILQLLTDKMLSLKETTHEKCTILHIACSNARYDMCKHILHDVNEWGWNAAHYASQGGDVRILQLLAEKGVSIKGTTEDKCTILRVSCSNGNYEMSQYILSKYPEMIDSVNEFGWRTPHYAARGGNINILQLLIDKGVSLSVTTHNKETLLHIACLYARYEICKYLLSVFQDNLQDMDARGWNAAHFAAQGGDVRILQLLADRNLSLKETTYNKCTILHISCSYGKYDMCKGILQVLSEILHDVSECGWNAAHYAADGGNMQILNLLSQSGLKI
ncbi:receptor-interacting serine/threonine-protein kinase 4-like [Saccostrea echinata]|uniref:receptor-interacting serine/threonine-protein kinase 4-like n=1 Tax=Saccostrea echinata TaxID=191078 RepID=UPI002A815F42|nr:receptor-interacting serine/threonine-protein kinase 4-like [Saccostrea echinata]